MLKIEHQTGIIFTAREALKNLLSLATDFQPTPAPSTSDPLAPTFLFVYFISFFPLFICFRVFTPEQHLSPRRAYD